MPHRFGDADGASNGYSQPLAVALTLASGPIRPSPPRSTSSLTLGLCREICIPASAHLRLDIGAGDAADATPRRLRLRGSARAEHAERRHRLGAALRGRRVDRGRGRSRRTSGRPAARTSSSPVPRAGSSARRSAATATAVASPSPFPSPERPRRGRRAAGRDRRRPRSRRRHLPCRRSSVAAPAAISLDADCATAYLPLRPTPVRRGMARRDTNGMTIQIGDTHPERHLEDPHQRRPDGPVDRRALRRQEGRPLRRARRLHADLHHEPPAGLPREPRRDPRQGRRHDRGRRGQRRLRHERLGEVDGRARARSSSSPTATPTSPRRSASTSTSPSPASACAPSAIR